MDMIRKARLNRRKAVETLASRDANLFSDGFAARRRDRPAPLRR